MSGAQLNIRRSRGFTLLEIMVVVVIIGILIGLIAPNIIGRVDQARVTGAKTDIATLSQALDLYKLDNHFYPTTDQGLQALLKKPTTPPIPQNWRPGGYLKKHKIPIDPWGNAYRYISPGTTGPYDLYSLGADGKEGGQGNDADIGNWDN